MRIIIISTILSFFVINKINCQEINSNNLHAWYIEPEFMAGKIVPNYKNFPSSQMQSSFVVSFGRINYSPNSTWTGFYNYPFTGITTTYSVFGNDSVLGKQIGLIPFLEINTSRNKASSFCFKFGLGASYFTTYYNLLTNKTNKAIGSNFTWAFQLFLYYKLNINDRLNLKFGGGYLHNSNGHTQLPNYGLNSAMISISSQYFFKPMQFNRLYEPDLTRHYFIDIRSGIGMQEYGASKGPAGGPKKAVYSYAVSGGVIFKQNISIHAGLAYRYYQHFHDNIIKNKTPEYIDNPNLNASNVYFFLGSEFLIGHASIDIEGGINLYKPFKDGNIEIIEGTKYWLKKLFPSRMGLKLYAINTSKMPKNNMYVAANINANFGQADFSELSFGFVHLLK